MFCIKIIGWAGKKCFSSISLMFVQNRIYCSLTMREQHYYYALAVYHHWIANKQFSFLRCTIFGFILIEPETQTSLHSIYYYLYGLLTMQEQLWLCINFHICIAEENKQIVKYLVFVWWSFHWVHLLLVFYNRAAKDNDAVLGKSAPKNWLVILV